MFPTNLARFTDEPICKNLTQIPLKKIRLTRLVTNLLQYNHYRLHHSDGKYRECGRCGHIDTAGALANHDCTGQSLICQHCAKVFRNPACLAGHVKNMHVSFECHDCGVTIVGYRKYCRHRMKAHDKMRYECDQGRIV